MKHTLFDVNLWATLIREYEIWYRPTSAGFIHVM